MSPATNAPIRYGEWPSPISAEDVARGFHAVGGGRHVGAEIWWAEVRSTERGRTSIRRYADDGSVVDVLPAPWNARTRVHEYGGGGWTTYSSDGTDRLIFANFSDQRLYSLVAGEQEPEPLTPPPAEPSGDRYAELEVLPDREHLLCIREHHEDGKVSRDLVMVPLDGRAATDPAAIRSVVAGSDFLAAPALSPNGQWLAWIAWDHPQLPWDGTELRVASFGADGTAGQVRTLLGSPSESVLQPTWLDDDRLLVASDRSDHWNLHLVTLRGGDPTPLAPMPAEVGGPMWTLGAHWWIRLDDGQICFVRNEGTDALWLLDPITGSQRQIALPDFTDIAIGHLEGSSLLVTAAGPKVAPGLREIDLGSGSIRDIRLGLDELPPAEWLPEPVVETFTGPGGRDVHAIVYPPAAPPEIRGPEGELPPYIVRVHGGPTAQVQPHFDYEFTFWTSRGIGVVDVNYGGSTGYGRAYRERLREQWGIVDVEDVAAVASGLADNGRADRDRIAIMGGSAGGWTVLAALTSVEDFACGISYFGVSELLQFAETTHDFESRYLDGLVGPLPEAQDLYVERAPLNRVDEMRAPVLLLQGLDDPIVPPAQAELFRDAVQRKHIPHAYIAFEGESHGFRQAETNIRCLEASLSFLGQVFGFDPPGVKRLELAS